MALGRREFVGGAPQTTLNGDITLSSLAFTVTNGTGYPTGGVGKFKVVIDPGTASEEKILCTSRTSNSFVVDPAGRGADNTVPVGHTGAAIIQHVFGGDDANDNNDHIYTLTRDDHTQYARTDGSRAFTGGVTINSGGLTVSAGTTTTQAINAQAVSGTAISGTTVTGSSEVKGTDFNATGLTGAVAASRYVGATASGAPGSGTFLLGDYIIDQTGTIWVCTTAGSPGTWTVLPKDSLVVHLAGTETVTGAKTFSAQTTTLDLNVTGLTGAVTASRYVGATAGGAPSSGTFVAGDFIIDTSGAIFICTAGGTPGTWVKLMNDSKIADATTLVTESTTSQTYTDLTTVGPAVTVVTGTSAIVTISCGMWNGTAGGNALMSYAVSGASSIAAADPNSITTTATDASAGIYYQNCNRQRVTGLTAGSNTFTAKYRAGTSGTASFLYRYILVEPL